MKTKSLLLSLITFFWMSGLNAQPAMDVNNASDYLMLTTEQQEIYLGRYLNANPDIVKQCQPDWKLDKANNYFIQWVTANPQFLRRNLTSAFSAALLSSCKLSESK